MKEIEIQERIIEKLQSKDISPFSVIFSYESGNSDGMLGITFYLREDLLEVLDILNYKNQCDKTGWVINEKENTLIVTDLALLHVCTTLL